MAEVARSDFATSIAWRHADGVAGSSSSGAIHSRAGVAMAVLSGNNSLTFFGYMSHADVAIGSLQCSAGNSQWISAGEVLELPGPNVDLRPTDTFVKNFNRRLRNVSSLRSDVNGVRFGCRFDQIGLLAPRARARVRLLADRGVRGREEGNIRSRTIRS